MKRLGLLVALLALAGCVSQTAYGHCVGIADDKNPKLNYKLSVRNTVVGIVFLELIVPPVKILVDETFCPVGARL